MAPHFPTLKVKALKNQALIADKCFVAERFFDRLRGLIGRRTIEPGFGMLFPKCNNIHMWFMSAPIDVIFLRKVKSVQGQYSFVITSAHREVKPWRFFPLFDFKATETLELPVGTIDRCEAGIGDELVCTS